MAAGSDATRVSTRLRSVGGTGGGSPGFGVHDGIGQGACDLECIERIPARKRVDGAKRRQGQRDLEAADQQLVERAE